VAESGLPRLAASFGQGGTPADHLAQAPALRDVIRLPGNLSRQSQPKPRHVEATQIRPFGLPHVSFPPEYRRPPWMKPGIRSTAIPSPGGSFFPGDSTIAKSPNLEVDMTRFLHYNVIQLMVDPNNGRNPTRAGAH